MPTPHRGVKEALLARFLFAPAFLTAEALSVEIACQVAEKRNDFIYLLNNIC